MCKGERGGWGLECGVDLGVGCWGAGRVERRRVELLHGMGGTMMERE